LTFYFGTVEYFEEELRINLTDLQAEQVDGNSISNIYTKVEKELINDFVCDEELRKICLQNLAKAYGKIVKTRIRQEIK
jgi:hypothetical protein